ncbi:lipoyl(octanoyl) transferase LipB [Desulfogranum mediterraneum]|uniref:lipoyl(octanoyl) transferase LipB n=1 Tax=Desulfogranum mediterraneum TaxID=160661 RepID=UPI000425CCB2|nr:lipoyl(octanoyl) transferase LipB [Desulfogranum mediterraneum]
MEAAWCDLEQMEYDRAYSLQTRLVELCRRRRQSVFILNVEHPRVFTLGRRGGREHLMVSPERLEAEGIQLVQIERGGEITYHGPGQLVLYPIFHLRSLGLSVSAYVELLEEVMLRTAADHGIRACRDPRNHGVWVGDDKLGSIGIAIRHGVTFHGLALNVNTELTPFGWINPCGLTNTRMTSFACQGQAPEPREVQQRLNHHLAALLNLTLTPTPLTTLEAALEAARKD